MNEKIPAETENKLNQLQLYQQRLQVFAAQKQQLQIQQIEIDNALEKVSKTKKPVYSLIGGIMIERKASDVNKELADKKKEINIKINNIERQEKIIKKKVEEIQKELTKLLK